jgi:hypothetical protein
MLDSPPPDFHRWLWISQPWFESTSRSLCPSQQRCETPSFLNFLLSEQCRSLAYCASLGLVG